MKSVHKDLLNDLVDMQQAPTFATRKRVLILAEELIWAQEQEIARLRNKVERLEQTLEDM